MVTNFTELKSKAKLSRRVPTCDVRKDERLVITRILLEPRGFANVEAFISGL